MKVYKKIMKVQIPDSGIFPAFDMIWNQCRTPQVSLVPSSSHLVWHLGLID